MNLQNLLSRFYSQPRPNTNLNSLSVETLEERMMLSTVSIFAAGSTGQENIELVINDQVVQTFNDIGGDPSAREFQQLVFQKDEPIAASDVRIRFTNDLYDPANGIDRNVTVDRIVIDGATFETESSQVFSTGTWLRADGVADGFGRGETLHSNGFFQFSDDSTLGTQLSVDARGEGGDAIFDIIVDGNVVATFTATSELNTFNFFVAEEISADQIQIAFTNDFFDPVQGVDVNLVVERLNVNGTEFSTNDASVFSTGTYLNADGITPGFGRGNTLHANGFFQFGPVETAGQTLEQLNTLAEESLIITVNDETGQFATLSTTVLDFGDAINLFNADGTLDTRFGGNGSVILSDVTGRTSDSRFRITDIDFFPDGSLLLTGSDSGEPFSNSNSIPYVLKLRPNGEVDSSFNNGTRTDTTLGETRGLPVFEAAVDSTGAVTLIGKSLGPGEDFGLTRLDDFGNIDTNWANNGTLTISPELVGENPILNFSESVVLGDGSILVALTTSSITRFSPSFVAKVNPGGFLDASYGDGGIVTLIPEQEFVGFTRLRVDSQGRAVLLSSGATTGEIVRLDLNGNLDVTFNQGAGRVNFLDETNAVDSFVGFNGLNSIVVDNQDRILLTANLFTRVTRTTGRFDGTVVFRFSADGSLDTSFDDDGIQLLDVNTTLLQVGSRQIAIDADGNLLISAGATGPTGEFGSNSEAIDRSLTRFQFAPNDA